MIVLEEGSEIFTERGEFPIGYKAGEATNVWNGERLVSIKPFKVKVESPVFRMLFGSSYTYPGCSVKHGILFDTYIIGRFNLKIGEDFIGQESVKPGDLLTSYLDNQGNTYDTFSGGFENCEWEKMNFIGVNEKVNFIINGVMVYNN